VKAVRASKSLREYGSIFFVIAAPLLLRGEFRLDKRAERAGVVFYPNVLRGLKIYVEKLNIFCLAHIRVEEIKAAPIAECKPFYRAKNLVVAVARLHYELAYFAIHSAHRLSSILFFGFVY
jgi:hypothetical protein